MFVPYSSHTFPIFISPLLFDCCSFVVRFIIEQQTRKRRARNGHVCWEKGRRYMGMCPEKHYINNNVSQGKTVFSFYFAFSLSFYRKVVSLQH